MSMVEIINLQNENATLKEQRAQLLGEIDVLRQALSDWAGPEITSSKQVKIRVMIAGAQGQAFADEDVNLEMVLLAKDQLGVLAGCIKPAAFATAQSFLQNMGVLKDPSIIHPI